MIYAIIGPTGVGKTKISIMLAKKLNAEIINCDSMQVYKELNIGTAKIKDGEKESIKHHMFDIRSIKDDYSVFNYQQEGRAILNELLKENKNVVIVGGTGLYLKALLYDYQFDNIGNKNKKLYKFRIIGLTKDREKLYDTINKRVDMMIEDGLLDEAKSIYDSKISSNVLKRAIGYKELFDYFDSKQTLNEAIEKIKKVSRNYAKRQYTFFNNQFEDIIWYDVDKVSSEEIVCDITKKD